MRTSVLIGISTATAGCNTDSTDPSQGDGTATDEGQQTEADPDDLVRYFFDDETGALGHLGDENIPNDANIITNDNTERDYQEIQRNDRQYPEGMEDGQLNMTVNEIIDRTREIYNNPTDNLNIQKAETLGIDLINEDKEILFTRALIKSSQEAGVDSSGLADIVVANIAEDAIQEIEPGFQDFKLSTLPATEALNPEFQGHTGGVRETEFGDEYGNSGFRHLPALLQYTKNGESNLKYAEQIESVDATPDFFRSIRDPEESIYRTELGESVNTTGGGNGIRFPEHYVTAFDYEKTRELERSNEDILGYIQNDSGLISSLGDQIEDVLRQLVDDMGVTGYNNNEDLDLESAQPDYGGTLVSDQFGDSLEEYILHPTTEKRQYIESIGRGLFQIRNQMGMDASIAITGDLENPAILPTDQETVNEIRLESAYDEVVVRVME